MRFIKPSPQVIFEYRKLSIMDILEYKAFRYTCNFIFITNNIKINDVMWDMNFKDQFLHLVEELDVDHENTQLFIPSYVI